MASSPLTGVVAEYLRATNAHDLEGIMRLFTRDAFVTDAGREFRGAAAIREFVAKEIVGDEVTYHPVEVTDHHGMTVVRAVTDGTFDKSKLPDPLVLTHYFQTSGDLISAQITVLVKNLD